MQSDLKSASLSSQPLALPFPRYAVGNWSHRTAQAPIQPISALHKMQREALRNTRFEQITWLALLMSSVVALLLSFWM